LKEGAISTRIALLVLAIFLRENLQVSIEILVNLAHAQQISQLLSCSANTAEKRLRMRQHY
jgi:hypothetical protein